MREGCTSISKVDLRQCLLRVATSREDSRVASIRDHKAVSNKVDILDSSKEAITKVVISRMVRMMS
jgi:hypothetical protein